MTDILKFSCPVCDRVYQPGEVQYFCPHCGQVGTLDVLYDYQSLRATLDRDTFARNGPLSMWRYRPLLPLQSDSVVPPLRVGFTPLYDTPRLATSLGVSRAWVKDDGANPTASLKDRASALVVARALESDIRIVSTASTGNAAAALAGVAASSNIQSIIFVPATAPEAKITQLLVYGAIVLLIEGTYDTAFDLCYQMCVEQGWYCRNTAINPFTTEGKKTVAYEIAEQLGWNLPDVIIVSVGDGNIISGIYKGFWDLLQLGWIERIPRLIGVQSTGSAPLVEAWQQGLGAADMQPIEVNTIADSISAGLPRDRAKALRAVRNTGGALIAVSDAEILESIPLLARLSGVFAEPAAAASFAGARRAVQSGLVNIAESLVLLVTGSGLKDIKHAQETVTGGIRVPPDLAAIRSVLQRIDK